MQLSRPSFLASRTVAAKPPPGDCGASPAPRSRRSRAALAPKSAATSGSSPPALEEERKEETFHDLASILSEVGACAVVGVCVYKELHLKRAHW